MAQGSQVTTTVPEEVPPEIVPPEDDPALEPEVELAPDVDESRAIEARAREMGWKPLAEYKGPPGKWRPAKEFVERGENILPIVRDQNRRFGERIDKLEGEISGLRSTISEQLQVMNDLRAMAQRAEGRGYERAMAEIKVQKRKAVETGDTAMFDQLEATEQQIREEHAPKPNGHDAAAPATPQTPTPAAPPEPSQAARDFVAANRWFNTDPFLRRKMIETHTDVIEEGVIADEAAQMEEAKGRIMAAYPERFGIKPELQPPAPPTPAPRPRPRAAAVAQPSSASPPPARQQAATINSIQDPKERADAREAFNRIKRQIPTYTEAEYMALYDDPHADVLAMQQPKR